MIRFQPKCQVDYDTRNSRIHPRRGLMRSDGSAVTDLATSPSTAAVCRVQLKTACKREPFLFLWPACPFYFKWETTVWAGFFALSEEKSDHQISTTAFTQVTRRGRGLLMYITTQRLNQLLSANPTASAGCDVSLDVQCFLTWIHHW